METKPTTRGFSYKLKKCYEFLSLLTVEPYLFAWMFVYMMKKVPTDQIIQDKICRNVYHLNSTYCADLSGMADADDDLGMKSVILTDNTTYMMIAIIFITLPSVVASPFIGSWADTYINAKKVMMIGGAVSTLLEVIILLINDYAFDLSHYVILASVMPGIFTGGLMALLSSIWSYIAATTPANMRAMRMAVAEIIIALAQPLGTYLGGLILNTKPIFSTGQLHNSATIFIICGIAFALALIWCIFMVDERRDVGEWERRFNRLSDTETDEEVAERVRQKLQKYDDNQDIHPIKLLLNLNNARVMWRTCTKPRDGWIRLQIWLLFLSMTIYLLSHVGPVIILFQFTQKMYNWDSETYSNGSAITTVTMALGTFIVAPILIRVVKLKDPLICIIGLLSYFTQNIIRGTVLTAQGFYLSLLPGCLGSLGSIGIRTHFSKIIQPNELGKVFSSLAMLEAITPLLAAGIFTNIFNATIDTNGGLTLILIAAVLVVPFMVMVWIQIFTVLPQSSHIITNDSNESTIDCKPDVNRSEV